MILSKKHKQILQMIQGEWDDSYNGFLNLANTLNAPLAKYGFNIFHDFKEIRRAEELGLVATKTNMSYIKITELGRKALSKCK